MLCKITEHIRIALPSVFLLENVMGFKAECKGKTCADFLDRLKAIKDKQGEIAYNARMFELDSRDYGSPQTRHRLYFVGLRRSEMIDPEASMAEPKRVRPPELEEILEPKLQQVTEQMLPGSRIADGNLRRAVEIIRKAGGDPYVDPYVIDVDKSENGDRANTLEAEFLV